MSRLYLRFYVALLGSLIVFAAITALVWHGITAFVERGAPVQGHGVQPLPGLVAVLVVLALGVGISALPIVRQLTRRLERLQAGVESLGSGDLSARVAVEGQDEVGQLATSFNRAASRIQALVGANRALLANVSHELRTPLARIRLTVELMKESAEPKRKAELEQDIAELDALIDELLLSSRLDAVNELESVEDVDLLALAAEECARFEQVDLSGDTAIVRGDPRLLRRLLRNLLENAERHGLPPIRVTVAAGPGLATLVVADGGQAIPAEQRERLFEPFFRRADARDRRGAGLGLSLVRQIARRHGGDALCAETATGLNSFVVSLPSTEEPRPI